MIITIINYNVSNNDGSNIYVSKNIAGRRGKKEQKIII